MANWSRVTRTIKYCEHLNDNYDNLLESECGLAWEWETIGGYSVEQDTLLSILPPETPQDSHRENSRKTFSCLWKGKRTNHCTIWLEIIPYQKSTLKERRLYQSLIPTEGRSFHPLYPILAFLFDLRRKNPSNWRNTYESHSPETQNL